MNTGIIAGGVAALSGIVLGVAIATLGMDPVVHRLALISNLASPAGSHLGLLLRLGVGALGVVLLCVSARSRMGWLFTFGAIAALFVGSLPSASSYVESVGAFKAITDLTAALSGS